MKTLTAQQRRELARLQNEYDRIHERMGYMYSPAGIAAANRALDRLVERMDAILNTASKSN